MMKKIFGLLIVLMPVFSMAQSGQMITFSFNLNEPATVSAGVYNGDKLIRTLFSNKKYSAGKHEESYEALDDDMHPIINGKGLTVKVLSNNVKYEWEGVIGNTSAEMTGPTVHKGFKQINSVAISNGTAYYSNSYSEAGFTQHFFKLSDIQHQSTVLPIEKKGIGQQTAKVVTDGNYVYWAGKDAFAKWFNKIFADYVFATKCNDNTEVLFEYGAAYKGGIGKTYKSVIDNVNDEKGAITGIAVQKDGPYLFIAHGKLNELHVLNKITGKLIRNLPYTAITALAIGSNNELWVLDKTSARKYDMEKDAALSSPLLTINGFSAALSIAVSLKNNEVLIADIKTQQVKAFNTLNGDYLWTLGQKNGYYANSLVADDKFYFSDERTNYPADIAFQDDGSFWLVDGGNFRLLHFSANKKLLEKIMYLPKFYGAHVDPTMPSSVFAGYLEFEIDYSKPLQKSWKLVRNWGATITKKEDNLFSKIKPVRLSNGNVYSLLRSQLVELKDTIRRTGIIVTDDTQLLPDALYRMPRRAAGKPMLFTKQIISGFTNNNPVFDKSEIIAGIPIIAATDPGFTGYGFNLRAGQITENKTLVVFDGANTKAFHLGGIKLGDTSFVFRTANATSQKYHGDYPDDGSYDIGNGVVYSGNVALASGPYILWGYHGEFWKQSQVNKWNFLYENGLMLGQFGITGPEVQGKQAPPEMAGNVFSASVIKLGEVLYLYLNDESYHSGVHRWKITNLNTIKVQSITPAFKIGKTTNAYSLMKEIPQEKKMENNIGGWVREPANDIRIDKRQNWWTVTTNVKSYNQFSDPDINVNFNQKKEGVATLSKSLGNNNTNEWTLTGLLNYDGNFPAVDLKDPGTKGSGGQFLEILDQEGKIIFRFFPLMRQRDDKTRQIEMMANGIVIGFGAYKTMQEQMSNFQPVTVKMSGKNLFIKYASFKEIKIPVFDTIANLKSPATVRLYFWSNGNNPVRTVSIKDFEFTNK